MSSVDQLRKQRGDQAVVTIAEDATVSAAAILMSKYHIGSVVIVNDRQRLAGVMTERDVLLKVIAAGLDPKATKVCEVMSRKVVTVTPRTTIQQAKDMMARHSIRHLPVMEGDILVGMISSRDIMLKQLSDTREVVRRQLNILHALEREYPGISTLERDQLGRVVI